MSAEQKPKKYVASCSFGKDSLASIILAHEHGEPLDEIIYCEVMFSKEISGEIPEHRDFIYNTAIPKLEAWGYKVTVIRGPKTYLDCFYRVIEKPTKNQANKGKRKGFVMVGHCDVQRDCKIRPIEKYFKQKERDGVMQYLGIAIDEPKRLKRIREDQISLLAKYGYTEQMAKEKCQEYGLLSPIYNFAPRGGCWFCPNAGYGELKHLRTYHRDLWNKLLELEKEPNLVGKKWNTAHGISMADNEDFFFWEAAQMTIFDFLEMEAKP